MCKVCTEAVDCVALWTRVTLGLGVCKVCTEAVDCVALWTRVTLGLDMCKVCNEAVHMAKSRKRVPRVSKGTKNSISYGDYHRICARLRAIGANNKPKKKTSHLESCWLRVSIKAATPILQESYSSHASDSARALASHHCDLSDGHWTSQVGSAFVDAIFVRLKTMIFEIGIKENSLILMHIYMYILFFVLYIQRYLLSAVNFVMFAVCVSSFVKLGFTKIYLQKCPENVWFTYIYIYIYNFCTLFATCRRCVCTLQCCWWPLVPCQRRVRVVSR